MTTAAKKIADMTTKEMVFEYNNLTGKNISKFSDRARGEKQLATARATFSIQPAEAPAPAAKETPQVKVAGVFAGLGKRDKIEPAAVPTVAKKRPADAKPTDEVRSKAIKDSWSDSEIAWKRSQRNGVTVQSDSGKQQYRSVLAAFQALSLPVEKHIKFRMTLKEKGSAIFNHEERNFQFAIIRQEKLV